MLSKQSSTVNEAIVVFVGDNEDVCFLDESTRLPPFDNNMASQVLAEEGEEATEKNEEEMTTFGPYVAERSGVIGLSMYNRREVGGQQRQYRQQPVGNKPRGTGEQPPEQAVTGISVARDLFRRIRSSLSFPQAPPSTPAVSARTGATRRPPDSQPRRQSRPTTSQPARAISHAPSAPVLNKAPVRGRVQKPFPATRAAPKPSRKSRSRETSPSVIEDMASFGPGSGRRDNRSPTALAPKIDRETRSKSEEPSPTSTNRDKHHEPDENSKVLHSASSDAHITLVSYSDVHKRRAPAGGGSGGTGGGGVGGGVGTTPDAAAVLPLRVKQQLNKQDVLKRIGSIGSDEVGKKRRDVNICHINHTRKRESVVCLRNTLRLLRILILANFKISLILSCTNN